MEKYRRRQKRLASLTRVEFGYLLDAVTSSDPPREAPPDVPGSAIAEAEADQETYRQMILVEMQLRD